MRKLLLALGFAAAVLAPCVASAQTTAPAAVQTDPQGRAVTALSPVRTTASRPAPLGSSLFAGGSASFRGEAVDPNYVMKPGDRVRVSLWGLVQPYDHDLHVDPAGNIVVPGVGPIQISGLRAAQVPGAVESSVRRVYSEGVGVYAAPLSAGPIQVFVTGPVARPGPYAGSPSESVVTFLQRAGGVDVDRGSYRDIRIMRGGRIIARTDLYDFLRDGARPDLDLRDGDAIVVGDQGPIVSVEGAVRAPFTFELTDQSQVGASILGFARPRPEATHAAVSGVRDGKPFATYVDLRAFATMPLRDGDRVRFEADARAEQRVVRVEGSHQGPSVFTLARGATVGQLMEQITLSGSADRSAVHLRRVSVAAAQKQLLDESLAQLERAVFLSGGGTPGEAAARAQEAEFVAAFVERARRVQPSGVVALADAGDLNAVLLEPEDVLVIPAFTQVVNVAGEVQTPVSVIHRRGLKVNDYVRMSGGFTRRADRGRILVLRPDGGVRTTGTVEPGDRILVPAKADSRVYQMVRDITAILAQMAVTVKVASDL